MKLLIIEDDPKISSFLKSNLGCYGFITDVAKTGQSGLDLAETNNYNLIILDLNLPDLSGQKVCEKLRQENNTTPILVLSADLKTDSKISLLNLGVDDYMTKPFSLEELLARIKALSRRPLEISRDLLIIEDIILDKNKQIVSRQNKEIYLTRKEFLLLEYLMSHPGVVISRGEMMDHVWDMEANFFSKTIETHILHLRNKLDIGRAKPLIKTVSGRGYKFG